MSPKGPRGNFKHQSVRVSMASIYSSHWNGRTGNTSNSSKKIMYDPWNFGGAKSFIFRGLGGLAPPSPYVEPPLQCILAKIISFAHLLFQAWDWQYCRQGQNHLHALESSLDIFGSAHE